MTETCDAFFLGSVMNESASEDRWFVTLPIQGRSVKFKNDTGADITIMSRCTYESLQGGCPLVVDESNMTYSQVW